MIHGPIVAAADIVPPPVSPPCPAVAQRRATDMQARLAGPLLALPRSAKRLIVLGTDVGLCVLATWVALYLRTGEWVALSGDAWPAAILSPLLAVPLFVAFGLYRAIFRYAGWEVLASTARAVLVYGILYAALFTAYGVPGVPRTLGLIQPGLLLLAVGASRASARHWLRDGRRTGRRATDRPRVLIYGAGGAGRQLAFALGADSRMQLMGFIDDDAKLHGTVLNGRTVHPASDLPALVARLGIIDVLLAIPSTSQRRRGAIVEAIRATGAGVRTLPSLIDIAQGRVQVSDLRAVEIEDLLSRRVVPPDQALLDATIRDRTILVSGAGGSIGSELCRQILAAQPSRLLLLESSEFALYAIDGELRQRCRAAGQTVDIVPLLGSVRDAARLDEIFAAWAPQTVFHAAAYKHVPLVEHNPLEGIANNVLGTLALAQAARLHDVRHFILVSTDKAVRPTNVMGATKRLAEMILQALHGDGGRTCFTMVRFGNVLGSSGSVVPLFRAQIAAGGPITLTDRRITRYFMTIPEAAQLVIQAAAMAQGGEVFVLDMGEPVRIVDLAANMLALSGRTVRDAANPDGDIEIVEVGLRPGEKLYEELLIGNDPRPTGHPRIMKASEQHLEWATLLPSLDRLAGAVERQDVATATRLLATLVPDYAAAAATADWVRQRCAEAPRHARTPAVSHA